MSMRFESRFYPWEVSSGYGHVIPDPFQLDLPLFLEVISSSTHSFEGVCVTHVILAPGACGGGVPAAVLDTASGEPGEPGNPGENSKWLVLEQHSITFGYLAGPRTAQKLALEQRPITFGYN